MQCRSRRIGARGRSQAIRIVDAVARHAGSVAVDAGVGHLPALAMKRGVARLWVVVLWEDSLGRRLWRPKTRLRHWRVAVHALRQDGGPLGRVFTLRRARRVDAALLAATGKVPVIALLRPARVVLRVGSAQQHLLRRERVAEVWSGTAAHRRAQRAEALSAGAEE